MKTPFWLDSNVFIEAKNRYYTFERVPKFWSFIAGQLEEGYICSPKAVYDELTAYKDELATWIRTRRHAGLCVKPDGHIQARFREVADYVFLNHPQHRSEEFLSGADPWVIATALHVGGTIVSHESTSRSKKVRIPTVCKKFQIECIDTFQMLEFFNARF